MAADAGAGPVPRLCRLPAGAGGSGSAHGEQTKRHPRSRSRVSTGRTSNPQRQLPINNLFFRKRSDNLISAAPSVERMRGEKKKKK